MAAGIGEYLILEEYMSKGFRLDNFDDFAFACETLIVKNKSEQEIFRSILVSWRNEIEKYISEQYSVLQKVKKWEMAPQPPVTRPDHSPSGLRVDTDEINKQRKEQEIKLTSESKEKKKDITEDETVEPEGEINLSLSDEKGAKDSGGQKFRHDALTVPTDPKKTFFFGTEYFPVSNRNLRQNWRSLKNLQDINQYSDLDIVSTIDQIARTGLFTEFQYQKKSRNLLSLFIFIDRGSNMVAAESFGKELAESALQSGTHLDIIPYYFEEIPAQAGSAHNPDYSLMNEEETETFKLSSLFRKFSKKNIVSLVYGDAGAIRGTRKEASLIREQETIEFLRYLLRKTGYTAWLNPAPKHRWSNTPAEKISKAFPQVSMLEANSIGIEQAVNVLKGKIAINN
ncbi:MAG: hypothetical protein H7Y86_04030 [Rhizobacter sp.]|nr:hypothetical protein [Ferruginibacter sp.]